MQPQTILIDSTLAPGTKSGYTFNAQGTFGGYAVWASPVTENYGRELLVLGRGCSGARNSRHCG
jgi:hypothetical protein